MSESKIPIKAADKISLFPGEGQISFDYMPQNFKDYAYSTNMVTEEDLKNLSGTDRWELCKKIELANVDTSKLKGTIAAQVLQEVKNSLTIEFDFTIGGGEIKTAAWRSTINLFVMGTIFNNGSSSTALKQHLCNLIAQGSGKTYLRDAAINTKLTKMDTVQEKMFRDFQHIFSAHIKTAKCPDTWKQAVIGAGVFANSMMQGGKSLPASADELVCHLNPKAVKQAGHAILVSQAETSSSLKLRLVAGEYNGRITPKLVGAYYIENYPSAFDTALILNPKLKKPANYDDLMKTSLAGCIAQALYIKDKQSQTNTSAHNTSMQYVSSLLRSFWAHPNSKQETEIAMKDFGPYASSKVDYKRPSNQIKIDLDAVKASFK